MNNDQPISPALNPITEPKPKRAKKILGYLLILLVVAGASVAITYQVSKPSDETPTNARANQSSATADTKAADASWHSVTYGTANTGSGIIVKLAFPEKYQAIAYDNDRESLRSLFGDDKGSSTYLGGDWKIGDPSDGSGGQRGNIEINGIASDWYSRNGYASYGGYNGDTIATDKDRATVNGYAFYTAQQKQSSLKKLASDTANCAKDPAKGFAISGIFNICYKPTMIRQASGSYDPQLQFSGHAVVKNVPYVLFGYASIDGGLDGYSEAALNKAGDNFQAGKIPAPTQKNIDSFIAALKHSSIDVK